MKVIFLILPLFYATISFGALYGFCLDESASVDSAISYLESVRSPKDNFFKRQSLNCLEVKGSADRFDLYKKFLSKKYRILRSYQGNSIENTTEVALPKGMCRILVTKTGKETSTLNTVKLGKRGRIKQSNSNTQNKTLSSLILSYGKSGSIVVDYEQVQLNCRKVGAAYQLTFSLNSQDSSLSSSAIVSKGKKLDLGGIMKDLHSKRRTISIDKGIEHQKESIQSNFDYFLEIQ